MKTFIIYSSERVYYRTVVEAENQEEAQQKFWDIDHNSETLEAYDGDNWTIDEIEDVENETITSI